MQNENIKDVIKEAYINYLKSLSSSIGLMQNILNKCEKLSCKSFEELNKDDREELDLFATQLNQASASLFSTSVLLIVAIKDY